MNASTALARTAESEVEVLVHVRLGLTTPPTTFETFPLGEPGVVHAWRTAGDIDFEVHLRCPGIAELHALLTRARYLGGAESTTSHLILSATSQSPTFR